MTDVEGGGRDEIRSTSTLVTKMTDAGDGGQVEIESTSKLVTKMTDTGNGERVEIGSTSMRVTKMTNARDGGRVEIESTSKLVTKMTDAGDGERVEIESISMPVTKMTDAGDHGGQYEIGSTSTQVTKIRDPGGYEIGSTSTVTKTSKGKDVIVDIKSIKSMIDKFTDSPYDPSNHTIARVPDFLRRENAEAYDPRIVSIGPIHHERDHVKDMNEHKKWYLQQLWDKREDQGLALENYLKKLKVGELERKARQHYSSLIVLPDMDVFALMLIIDGFFVIELARKWSFHDMVDPNDYIFQFTKGDSNDMDNKDHCNEELIQIRRDMLMIENQLPFFILSDIHEMTKTKDEDDLYVLLLKFFRRIIPGRPDGVSEKVVAKLKEKGAGRDHLLGLVYEAYFVDDSIAPTDNVKNFKFDEINSASELHEEGIQFKRFKRLETETESKKVKRFNLGFIRGKEVGATTLMNVKFEKGVMKIPQLEVGDVTESLFRNLIAYELIPFDANKDNERKHKARYVTEYCFLMQFLVNSKKDVEILRRAGIVINWKGDDETVRLFFNKLTKNVASSQEFYYANIVWSMNKYCKRWCNRKKWWTIFLRKYINTPWSILSALAAVILLLITATNIAFTILSYNRRKLQHKEFHFP